ncbi:MAG: carbon monoxide dehydrogenase, partial [Lachnospiraceae bacterium]|nr:carbon monoxide dehydrogenase [Lachnospiraceae bacterium]
MKQEQSGRHQHGEDAKHRNEHHEHEHHENEHHEHEQHGHGHHEHGPAHIHSHRNIIGFDEHGVPTVILKAGHGEGDTEDPQAFIRDYMNAVSEYRKTFPSKQDVIEKTPDPAVREMLLRMEQLGIDTAFDR